jgi:hypothetical protein
MKFQLKEVCKQEDQKYKVLIELDMWRPLAARVG